MPSTDKDPKVRKYHKATFPLSYVERFFKRYKIDTSNKSLDKMRLTVYYTALPSKHKRQQLERVFLFRWFFAQVLWAKDHMVLDLSQGSAAKGSWSADKRKAWNERQRRWARARERERARSNTETAPTGKKASLCTRVVLHREGRDPGAVPPAQGDGPRDPGVA